MRKTEFGLEQQRLRTASYVTIAIAAGLCLPIVLMLVVRATGYSELIEEVAKVLVVMFIILKLPDLKTQSLGALLFGFLFGLSENVFYLSNFIENDGIQIFTTRFLGAVPMHILTVYVIYLFARKNKSLAVIGFVISVAIHLLFNAFVSVV